MNLKTLKTLTVAATLAVTGLSASANLVTNGDFEAGDLGWNQGNFTTTSFNGFVPFGNIALFGGCVGQLCSTNQTISTVFGQTYVFEFEYGSDGNTPNETMALFGGQLVFHTVNDTLNTRPGYVHQSFLVTATSTSTVIDFRIRNDPSYQSIDNVSVTAAVIPEPASLALVGLGMAGIGFSRRKAK